MMVNREQAAEFASRWLPAWSGNDPEGLAAYYSEDAFYCDPSIPDGIQGKAALIQYFTKLLGQNPDWLWTQREPIPMEDGFVNKWRAEIPVANNSITIDGLCFVQFDEDGLIKRNEVYFDRSELLQMIQQHLSGRA